MTEINYVGENLIAGNLGRFFIYLSIIAGFLSLFYYIKVVKAAESNKLKPLNRARIFYYIQAFSVVIASSLLFSLILGHNFEYAYIFKHSSKLMPGKYIISSFWAGQEGSFLLWALLIATFGIGALHTSKKLEGGVMAVVSVSVIFLMTMILGVKFLGLQLGNSPFELLRMVEVNQSNEFFKYPDYLKYIADGNGLNPLLENPWMVIHPPVLFMGYAAALFPFAFALASLIQNDRKYWVRLTLPWVLLSLVLLGLGLLLGGAWAYQSLTFGGFWAWDPVENASLVPWLVLVAALHYLLLTHKREGYYWGSYIFTFLGFLTVVYASYLTRSGILGETSVHAFGDDGLSFQLLSFMFVFTAVPAWLLYKRRKNLNVNDLPVSIDRESMMLYGSIVILLSAFQIISTTSIPVFNKIFGTNAALTSDVVGYYNNWQMPFAMVVALLLGAAHYLTYDKNNVKAFWRNLLIPAAIALVVAVVTFFLDTNMQVVHSVFLFTIMFAVISSAAYLFRFITKGRNLSAGLTHLGFSLFLLGILITFSNTVTLTSGPGSATQGNNVMLFKGQVKQVGDQLLSYQSSREERDEIFYQIDFYEKDATGNNALKYSIYPSVKYSERMGNVHNPDTRNLLKGDVYMYLTFAEDRAKRSAGGYTASESRNISLNETFKVDGKEIIFDSLGVKMLNTAGDSFIITALMTTTDSLNNKVSLPLTYKLEGNSIESGIISIPGSDVRMRFDKVAEVPQAIFISLLEKQPEFIVLKVMFFPWIIVLWIGSIIMFVGITVALYKRAKKAKAVV